MSSQLHTVLGRCLGVEDLEETAMVGDFPPQQGLYDPRNEHDSCGVSFVCDIHGRATNDLVMKGVGALCNMEHRGAQGADIHTGDGAGILIQVPDRFYRDVVSFDLPEAGNYATGIAFLPQDHKVAVIAAEAVENILTAEGLTVLGWRDVPIDESMLGSASLMTMPTFRQVFVAGTSASGATLRGVELDRRARESAQQVADAIGAALTEPFLPAAPKKGACRFCDYRVVCGPYEELRSARKWAPPLAPLTAIRELP